MLIFMRNANEDETLSISFQSKELKLFLRASCLASLILLMILPPLAPLRSDAQGGNGEKLFVELTSDRVVGFIDYGERISISMKLQGKVEVKQSAPYELDLNGNGTGTVTYTDVSNDPDCTITYPVASFVASFGGHITYYPDELEGKKLVTIYGGPEPGFVFQEGTRHCKGVSPQEVTNLLPKGTGVYRVLYDELIGGKTFRNEQPPFEDEIVYAKISPLGEYDIDVAIDPPEIHLKYNLEQTDVLEKPKAKVTVTVTRDGVPQKDKAVLIKVCTLPGTSTTDGHIEHDKRVPGWEKSWNEPCNQGTRPFAELAKDGKKGNLLLVRTDSKGKIILDYTPPKFGSYQYIAGKDEIIATLTQESSLKQDKATVISKVPELLAMPGSTDGKCGQQGNANYNFASQGGSKHGCLFYGKSSTNNELRRIADEFVRRQQECKDNPDSGACAISYPGLSTNVTITGNPVKMRINAMSLPWGGLTDNVGGIMWAPPHKSHNDGRQADLSFSIFKLSNPKDNELCKTFGNNCKNYDIDRILLLRDIIDDSGIFYRFPSNEGGDLLKTFNDKAPHIHIFFR